MRSFATIVFFIALALGSSMAAAQPMEPLQPPVAPPGNPITMDKVRLGKALFWDEQLSSTRTTACATCHRPAAAGSDPRSIIGDIRSTNPGPDEIYWTDDDITASPGLPMSAVDGAYLYSVIYGHEPQVGRRRAPSAINAGYSPLLFWDGRATDELRDPITNELILPHGATLENQALKPPLGSAEMAHIGRDWKDVVHRVKSANALAMAVDIPQDLEQWIDGRSYPALFREVFGTPEVTASRITMAIATYERTLFSNQSPFDDILRGRGRLTPQEQHGWQLFNTKGCIECHPGNRLTDERFHYLGIRPPDEDLGRMEVTGLERDKGAFRTPTLRNIELRPPYFHNGQAATLEEVVEFYDRGGDFDAPNKHPLMVPLNLTQQEKDALVALMKRPLTDPRVAAELPPFDHPTLYTNSDRVPIVTGEGSPGSGGFVPHMVAFEPPMLGNDNCTVGVSAGLGGARAFLVIDTIDPGEYFLNNNYTIRTESRIAGRVHALHGSDAGEGTGYTILNIPANEGLDGSVWFARWFVEDPQALGGWALSPPCEIKLFK